MFPGAIRRGTEPNETHSCDGTTHNLRRKILLRWSTITLRSHSKHGCYPLSPWVASLALSWPMVRSETCTSIEALLPCRLSWAGGRRVSRRKQTTGRIWLQERLAVRIWRVCSVRVQKCVGSGGDGGANGRPVEPLGRAGLADRAGASADELEHQSSLSLARCCSGAS